MAADLRSEMRKPVPIALAVLAVLGWAVVLSMYAANNSFEEESRAQLDAAELQRAEAEEAFAALQAASGDLQEVRTQIEARVTELADLEVMLTTAQQAFAAEMEELTTQRDMMLARVETVRTELETLMQQSDEERAALEQVRSDQEIVARDLQQQRDELAEAEARTVEQAQELADVGRRLALAREQSAQTQESLQELVDEAAEIAEELALAEARVQEARRLEASVQKQLADARDEITNIEERREALGQEIGELSTRRDQLTSDAQAALELRTELQEQVAELTVLLAARSEELAEIERRILNLQQQAIEVDREQRQTATLADRQSPGDAGMSDIGPGEYTAGPVTLLLEDGGNFRMTDEERSESVTGVYGVNQDVLTFSDATGDVRLVEFPLLCGIESTSAGFRLAEHEGACGVLADVEFARVE